jgi:hypothetical protein
MAYTTIDDPSAYFKVQLYTGNGSANHAITFDDTDTDMQPDLVWIKNRDATDSHCVFDAVRGATKVLNPDDYAAETTDTDTLDSFTSDGFQVDADVKVNTNTEKYVAWCWKANGSGSANTAGSINTTATSANTTSGFSILQYTGNATGGATIGHGLGVAPTFMMGKNVSDNSWSVYWKVLGPTKFLTLESNAAEGTSANRLNSTDPSSTLITLGSDNEANKNATEQIMYAFAPIQGFSKFGTYTGNGNADGTFVYTGFRPAWLLVKRNDASYNWGLQDTARDTYNPADETLNADDAASVQTGSGQYIDYLSNGFKMRNSSSWWNGSGAEFIYMAFAEAPFVNSNGVPCNAR